jgi:hypothetical protein
MIDALQFARLPNSLQQDIFKKATHNPFRKTTVRSRFIGVWDIYETRNTLKQGNHWYGIQASWETGKDGRVVKLKHLYIHRYTQGIRSFAKPVMTYFDDKLHITETDKTSYIQEILEVYKSRVPETTTVYTQHNS